MKPTQTMFLPLNSMNLAHYFASGCISPSRYYTNRPADIQSKFSSLLLLTKDLWYPLCDCRIEIILSSEEESNLEQLSEQIYLLSKPLPISRIKKVFFRDKEQLKTTEFNINAGAAFIPPGLFEVDDNTKLEIDNIDYDYDHSRKGEDWTAKLKKYDQFLGGLAMMKIGGESYMNYSENYFSLLSFFNDQVKNDFQKSKHEINNNFYNALSGGKPWDKILPLALNKITEEDVLNFAKEEKTSISKSLGLIKLDSISKNTTTYILAILSLYGEGKSKKTEDLISDINSKIIDRKKAEGILLLFGLNNGYSNLRNKYKVGNIEKPAKCKLLSNLDLVTIESIYQYTFNAKNPCYLFPYLELPLNNFSRKIKRGNYLILDEEIITKKKPKVGSPEYLEELSLSTNQAEITLLLARLTSKWIPPFCSFQLDDIAKYFEKELSTVLLQYKSAIIAKVKNDSLEENEELNKELYETLEIQSKEIDALKLQIREYEDKVSKSSKDNFELNDKLNTPESSSTPEKRKPKTRKKSSKNPSPPKEQTDGLPFNKDLSE